jgi:hypothetical protein
MRNSIAKTLSLAALASALAIGLTGPAQAQTGALLEHVPAGEKIIKIRPAEDNRLKVELFSEKTSYKPGEAIQLKVRGNQDFYLYLFNIDVDSKQAVTILPNRLQTEERIKYAGDNQWRPVPNKGIEFFSDSTGKERIIMLASSRYIDVNKLLEQSNGKTLGDFFLMEKPLEAMEELIGLSYGEKAIKVRETTSQLPPGIDLKEMYLSIE